MNAKRREVQPVVVRDEQWPVARLIPISSASGAEAQERRAASALMAVIGAVPEFGRALLKPLGAPAGRIETFIEVPFRLGDKSLRPDGVIAVTRAGRTWGALVEAKTGPNQLISEQVANYLDLARELEFNAVLSISNQYVTSSKDYPLEVDKRKLKRVSLHHWSWIDVLTEAIVQKEHRGITDPDQAYVLGELIRYLSDERSGAVAFDGMGSAWTVVRDGARSGTLRRGDGSLAAIAARWDDLVRYVALSLTAELGHEVRQALPSSERTATARRQALTDSLANRGVLYAELKIPDVAGTLALAADLRTRQVTASTTLEAPSQGTSKGRVSWLLRQLQQAPDVAVIQARTGRRGDAPAVSLIGARTNPANLYPEHADIRAFRISLSANMGLQRDSGRGSFVKSVTDLAEAFYGDMLQNIRAWKAPPPKLKRVAEEDVAESVADLVGVEPSDLVAEELPKDGPETGAAEYVEALPIEAPTANEGDEETIRAFTDDV